MDKYAQHVGSTVSSPNGFTFTVVYEYGSYYRKLTSDALPALERIVTLEGPVTILKRTSPDPAGFYAHTAGEMDQGWGATAQEALCFMLASALTSWDDFAGFEDY